MPFTKVSVDRVYKKTGSPTEKKDRHVRQVADEIFAALFPASSCLEHLSQKRKAPPAKQLSQPQMRPESSWPKDRSRNATGQRSNKGHSRTIAQSGAKGGEPLG